MTEVNEYPAHDQLADEDDELDWDRAKLGPMLTAVRPEPVKTVPYDPSTDPFLQEG